ncbi:bacillithiol system redox-active protein YtxJ [Texcoconibacillus texcoconensis]|uniref:Bacillithiol system protein YtxJ n=1 Tax=Texcoconibacillus texcoconensis TaxID=1095777 RepID=A0A840QN38_9BACI|nr:bacillithiol system redox-active protein YtxJ [Texcoconibacillus texcoconensis]MBB5172777.1 bacillithiol system protein YtxJ [Texcoconibacillus texcoconensis]
MELKVLENENDWKEVKEKQETFFLFKNSTTCPISDEAFKAYETFANNHANVPTYYLNVQEARPLSNAIAEYYSVKHQSPQVLLIVNDRAVWHDSHFNITTSALSDAVSSQ